MRQRRIVVSIVLAAVVGWTFACIAQLEGSALPSVEQRLAKFADRMRLSLSIASVAVFSPTVGDAHGQAQRLVLLLRGDSGDPVPGLIPQAALVSDWIAECSLHPDVRLSLLTAAANLQALLKLAIEAAVSATRSHTLAKGTEDLLRVYAYMLAAWGEPVNEVGVPGLVAILRAFDVPLTAEAYSPRPHRGRG